jgi:selenide,water dikinase
VDASAVPAISGVVELLARDDSLAVAGGTRRNRDYASGFTSFDSGVPEALRWLVCDAMTSGGLLAAVPASEAESMPGFVIGRLVEGEAGEIHVE